MADSWEQGSVPVADWEQGSKPAASGEGPTRESQGMTSRIESLGRAGGPTKAMWAMKKLSDVSGIPYEAIHSGAAMVAPTALSFGAAALASPALALPAGSAAVTAAAMAGSGAGEAINQKLGITYPSKADIGIATAMPGVAVGLQQGARAARPMIAPYLPGAGRILQERGAQKAEEMVAHLTPTVKASGEGGLYDQLHVFDPVSINASKLRDKAVTLLQNERLTPGNFGNEAFSGKLEQLVKDIDQNGGTLPFSRLRLLQKSLNENIESGPPGARKALGRAVYDSVESTPDAKQVAEALHAANSTYKREQGVGLLQNLFLKHAPEKEGEVRLLSGTARVNMKKAIDTNADLKDHFSPKVREEMKRALDAIGNLPAVPSAQTNTFTRAEMARYGIGGAASMELMHRAVGLGYNEAVLASVAAVGGTTALISKVLESDFGRRKVIEWATRAGKPVDLKLLTTIAAAMAAGGNTQRHDSKGAP